MLFVLNAKWLFCCMVSVYHSPYSIEQIFLVYSAYSLYCRNHLHIALALSVVDAVGVDRVGSATWDGMPTEIS